MSEKQNTSWLEKKGERSLIDLSQLPKSRKKGKRYGRGVGSGKGKTAARGGKGQTARAGAKRVRQFEGGQTPLHRRLPKRGFTSKKQKDNKDNNLVAINIDTLLSYIESGVLNSTLIKKVDLIACKLIDRKTKIVKLIGSRKKHSKLLPINIEVSLASASVIALIEASGGKVVLQ